MILTVLVISSNCPDSYSDSSDSPFSDSSSDCDSCDSDSSYDSVSFSD